MPRKNKSKSERNRKKGKMRNWMTNEVTIFAEVLPDNEFNFAECLEKEDLKKGNRDVFNSILAEFRKGLN